VGSDGGTLTQYKPDLKAVKALSPPQLGSGSVAVVNVLWLSNYQFAAIYRDKVNTEERPGKLCITSDLETFLVIRFCLRFLIGITLDDI
jgi:hypothetical protein